MKSISVFNNKGGVGKTTLTFHLAHALASLGHKTLIIDADPQCNLSIYSLSSEQIGEIWEAEDDFIEEGIESASSRLKPRQLKKLLSEPRSLHFIIKPTEDGQNEWSDLPPPIELRRNLHLICGRLSLHSYEEKVSTRWSDAYRNDPLAIRTISKIRNISEQYTEIYNYDYVIIDTSPSLGALNKTIISTVDGFFIPAYPDLFSLYGIRNIGKSLKTWKKDFETLYQLISTDKRKQFPKRFVSFLGYTIYNAKKYSNKNTWNLANAHLKFANKIPGDIERFIDASLRNHITHEELARPIGDDQIMHTHNTFPALAQHYHVPMWEVPTLPNLESDDQNTVTGSSGKLRDTKACYQHFARDLLSRLTKV